MASTVVTAELSSAALPPRKPRRSRLRCCLRYSVILALAGILSLGLLAYYLNSVGLPEMVKRPIVAEFLERGWNLEFSRLNLGWHNGLVIENLCLHRTNAFAGPQLYAPRAQVRFEPDALKRFQIHLHSLQVDQSRVFYPVATSNRPPRIVRLENVGLDLLFPPNDEWRLNSLDADLLGVHLHLDGILTNGSALATWRLPRPTPGTAKRREWLHQVVSRAEQIQHSPGTELIASFHGDALDLNTFNGSVQVTVPRLASPWLNATNLSLKASLPPTLKSALPSRVRLDADAAHTPWANASRIVLIAQADVTMDEPVPALVRVTGHLSHLASPRFPVQIEATDLELQFDPRQRFTSPTNIQVRLNLTNAVTDLAKAGNLSLDAQLRAPSLGNPSTNAVATDARIEIAAGDLSGDWGDSQQGQLVAHALLPPLAQLEPFATNLSSLARFPWPVDTSLTVKDVRARGIQAAQIVTTTQWDAPRLGIQHTSQLLDGRLAFQAELHAPSRQLSFEGNSSIDAQQVAPLLTEKGRDWLQRYQWKNPPKLAAHGRLILPAWTNRQPDWRHEVLPDISLAGSFEVGTGAYRGVPFNSAQSPFTLTNMIWRLPQLVVQRDEGAAHAVYESDQTTRDFHWNLDSRIDVRIAKPLLAKESAREKFDLLEFSTPPHIRGEVWGRWKDPTRLGANVRVAATNFSFRGQSATTAEARVLYTNQLLTLIHPTVHRGDLVGTAPRVVANFETRMVAVSNAHGNLPPQDVAAAIGPKTAKTMEPYHFDAPPQITVNGVIDTQRGRLQSDLHFDLDGGPFRWWHAHFENVTGHLHWKERDLYMTNLTGRIPGGAVTGHAHFYFPTNPGAYFKFHAGVTNTELRSFIQNIFEKTNLLEGTFAGDLVITNGFSRDTNSWQGYGQFELRDGLIWDIPVFGLFSPVLNTILPGVGNSRARHGTASFIVSNSVFHTSNMEIHASGMRMQYDGSVGADYTIDGTMEIEFLRNFPAFGPVISKVFWPVTRLFRFKIDGTLQHPQSEPVYLIPKILLLPLQPFKSIPKQPPPSSAAPP